MSKFVVRRDTSAWILQTWVFFAVSIMLCVIAVWNISGAGLDRAFVAIGMFFVLSAAFTLSKTIRDNQNEQVDTQFWIIQVWSAFIISLSLTAWGVFRMNIDSWHKWFLVGACVFLLSSAFSLAKTLRDRHDADVIEGKKAENE